MSNLGSNQPGSKHVPGAIAILMARRDYSQGDNGKRVKLLRIVPMLGSIQLRQEGREIGWLVYDDPETTANERIWEVEAVDGHLHLSANYPICVDNNCYKQSYLLIIGDESLVKYEPTVEQQHEADKIHRLISEQLGKV